MRHAIDRYKLLVISLLSYVGVAGILLITLDGVKVGIGLTMQYHMYWILYLFIVSALSILLLKPKISIAPVDGIATLLLVYSVVNCLYISNVVATTRLIEILLMGGLYLNLRIIFSTCKNIKYLIIAVLMVCGSTEAVIGIRQALGYTSSGHGLFRTTGTFFNPGPYAGYIAVMLSLAIAYLCCYYRAFSRVIKINRLSVFRKRWTILYLLCAGAAMSLFIVLPSTMSRAAFMSVAICTAIIILNNSHITDYVRRFRTEHIIKFRAILYSGIVIVISVGTCLYLLKQHSANGRLLMWSVAASIISDNPTLGVGIGGFPASYAEHQAKYFDENPASQLLISADCPEYAFNEYMQVGSEMGLLGLALFASLLLLSAWHMLKHRNIFAYGLIALMVFAFFSYPLSLMSFQVLLVVFVCMGVKNKPILLRLPHRIALLCAISAYAAVVIFSMKIVNDKVIATDEFDSLYQIYRMEIYDDIVDDYAKLYPTLKDNHRFIFAYGHTLNKLGQYERSNSVLMVGTQISSDPMFYNIIGNNYKCMKNYALAEQYYTTSKNILPNRLYPLYLLMKLYQESDQQDKARKIAREIVDFDPKIESSATGDMKNEAQKLLADESEVIMPPY